MRIMRIKRLYDANRLSPDAQARGAARRDLHITTAEGVFTVSASDRPAYCGRNGARLWHWMLLPGPYGDRPHGCGMHVLGLREVAPYLVAAKQQPEWGAR